MVFEKLGLSLRDLIELNEWKPFPAESVYKIA
jgi:hypothetical protein